MDERAKTAAAKTKVTISQIISVILSVMLSKVQNGVAGNLPKNQKVRILMGAGPVVGRDNLLSFFPAGFGDWGRSGGFLDQKACSLRGVCGFGGSSSSGTGAEFWERLEILGIGFGSGNVDVSL